MDLSDFDQLFGRLTEREPYPWQRRLYRRFMGLSGSSQAVPDRLDLPTGLGKTSVMAVWLAARINGADLPRRLVYVVDRRAVVDQATAEAERLAWNLDELLKGEHAGEIIRNLKLRPVRAGAEGKLTALPISTLRGQFLDNRRWFDDPASAAIVVGTVDMVGSRLLFSGYGVSRWMRPVHAALLGVDSLVLLDEAHLAAPFEAMLRGAASLIAEDCDAHGAQRPTALRPLQTLGLSATGADRPGEDVFRLEAEDWADERTAARLNAAKVVRLEPEAAPARLAETLADLAWSLRHGEDGAARRVVVFCNSRITAQKVEKALEDRVRAKDGYGKDARLTALLVGERRFHEREQLTDNPLFRRFVATEPQAPCAEPAFLVATSAGEVGVDLDADDLVCDLVAWERMVQRLGRVNRRPVPGAARVSVVPVAGEKEAEDEIDADRLKRLRAPFDCGLWETDAAGLFDGSPAGLIRLKDKEGAKAILQDASTPEPLRPPLTRATVEAWSLTSLETHTGRPKVDPWLRGWVEREPQTRVVWRRWLPLREGEAKPTPTLEKYLHDYGRPHPSEVLEARTDHVAKVLMDRAKALETPKIRSAERKPLKARPPESIASPGEGEPRPLHPVLVVVLDSEGEVQSVYDSAALANFRGGIKGLQREIGFQTIVVDARLGGLDGNGLLDGDEPERLAEHDVIGTASDVRPLHPSSDDAGASHRAVRPGWFISISNYGSKPKTLDGDKAGDWRLSSFEWISGEEEGFCLWVWLLRKGEVAAGDPAIARHTQTLKVHHAWAMTEAQQIAEALGLSPAHTAMLLAAIRAHDLGKDRVTWQDAMGAPNGTGRPYAKTEGGGKRGALDGYRHEFGSLNEVLAAPETHLKGVESGLIELAQHLIAAHHGRARPTLKAFDPNRRIDLSLPVAQAAALRFAALQGEWGPWGLAWWEALLRAADWAASAALNASPEQDKAAPEEAAHG